MPWILCLSPVTFMLWPRCCHCIPSTMELGNRTQVWLKTHGKKFQPSPNHPPQPTQRPFNNCSHWLQKLLPRHHYMYRNSKSITSSYNQQDCSSVSNTVTKPEDWAIWGSVFDSRQKKKCFSSAHRRKWFWGPSSLLTNVGGGLHPRGQRGREMKRNPRVRRMTRLRMRAAITSFPSSLLRRGD